MSIDSKIVGGIWEVVRVKRDSTSGVGKIRYYGDAGSGCGKRVATGIGHRQLMQGGRISKNRGPNETFRALEIVWGIHRGEKMVGGGRRQLSRQMRVVRWMGE